MLAADERSLLLTSRADIDPLPAGWRAAARVGEVRVLANDGALPPAFMVHAAQVVPDAAMTAFRAHVFRAAA